MATNQPVPVQVLQGTPGAVPPSSLFGLPGITNWTEQKENLDGTAVTLSQTNQVDAIFSTNFKQTDVVFNWQMEVTAATTWTAGGGAFTSSPYFPYNIVGPLGLNFQNQFDSVNFPSGIDAAILQMIRPSKFGYLPQVLDQNAQTNAYSAQVNASTATNYTNASTSIKYTLDLTPGILFNLYYDLEEDGRLYSHKATPIKAWVSPQLMSGTNRVVQPRVRFNPGISTTADNGPMTAAGGAPTFSGTATLGFRRKAIYQPANVNDTPPVFNWQYSRDYRRFPLAGVSSVDLPIPQVGQILSVTLRFFDPSANGAVGAPIAINAANYKEFDMTYGSGLFKFQDTPQRMQDRFYRQHGVLLPEGVVCWDMAITDDGQVTNSMALNTLITSGCNAHIDFVTTQSNTAYCVMLVEALRYVSMS